MACTNHNIVVDCWIIRNLCGFCNSTIHLYVVLMKKILSYLRSIGQFMNMIVVKMLLTLVYVLVILPYHIFMRSGKDSRWITYNQTYSQQDFIHMG